jgi:hypothetical protein
MQSKHDIWYRYGYENSARPPDRRHRLAKACLENGIRPSNHEDRWTWMIFRFLQRRDAATTGEERAKLRQEYHQLMEAYRLRSGKLSYLRPYVQAYILAAEPDDSIGSKVALHGNAIGLFRAAFFDIGHLRESRIRIVREVIGIDEESEHNALNGSRLWQLVGYLLKSKALDCLFYGDRYLPAQTDEDIRAWTSRRARLIAGLKQLTAAHALDVRRDGQMRDLISLVASFERSDQESEGQTKSILEQHVKAMLEDIPWMVGADAEACHSGTLLGEVDTFAAEPRDDEVQRLAAGEIIPSLDELRTRKIPAPRRTPGIDGRFGIPCEPQ